MFAKFSRVELVSCSKTT